MDYQLTNQLYKAAIKKDWTAMLQNLDEVKERGLSLTWPISMKGDTVCHLAAHSGSSEPLDFLLDWVELDFGRDLPALQNANGDTVLHEAAICGNLDAVKLLARRNGKLLEVTNHAGETPLFRAASFGKTRIVKYLASPPDPTISTSNDLCQRKDGASILHAAIQGKHFGTAIELLKRREDLSNMQYKNGTSLHMFANIPSVLKRGYQMGAAKKLLYYCIPIGYGHNDDTDDIEIQDEGTMTSTKEEGRHIESGLQVTYKIYLLVWKLINRVCPLTSKIWKAKRDHQFAYKLALNLVKKESTSESASTILSLSERAGEVNNGEEPQKRIPLFAATKKGQAESADEYIFELYPHAFDLINCRKPGEIEEEGEKRPKIPLFAATTTGNADQSIKFLLELYRDALEQIYTAPEVGTDRGGTSLFAATRTGNLELIKFLLELYPLALQQVKDRPEEDMEEDQDWGIPLFAAIRRGNVELFELIMDEYPQQLELTNRKSQNILHVAFMYRQKEIFDLVKKNEIVIDRLARQIDKDGYTVLHSVADTKYYMGGTRSGPAYKLQEELEWFQSVEKIMPTYCTMIPDKNKKTAFEIFKMKHTDQLKEAQQWMKDTSQSCSAVAGLVATVVFAAAFTVPGGTNDTNGLPILLYSPFFLFFTVMDVVSLSCSLTAVVMFLSVLTSPFELHDFLVSLPRRLTFGFTLLFMSVATTMLAFASTIFLVIHLDERRRWSTTLICCAAFLPVSVLALTHFPLFASFINSWKSLFKHIWKALPCNLLITFLKSRFQKSRSTKLKP